MTDWRRNPDLSVTEVDGEIFLIDRSGKDIYYLNTIGAGVWRAMATPLSSDEITDLLRAAFPEIPADQIGNEVPALLDDMVRQGVVFRHRS